MSQPRRQPTTLFTVFAVLALLLVLPLAACGGVDEDEAYVDGAQAPDTGEDTTVPAPADAVTYYGDEDETELGAAEVEVRLHDRVIEMPDSLPEGRTTFVVTNTGQVPHNFEVEGRGLEAELEQALQPGETGELTVDLAAGTYTVYCPVGDHQEAGMEKELQVTR